jgi:hypothetical protein
MYRNIYHFTPRPVAEEGQIYIRDVLERGAEEYVSAKRRGSKRILEKIA